MRGFLSLTRRVGERIMIGETVIIEVQDIKGTQVRLGIHAPGIEVDREEIRERKRSSAVVAEDIEENELPRW
jgi:carbon storage regulator